MTWPRKALSVGKNSLFSTSVAAKPYRKRSYQASVEPTVAAAMAPANWRRLTPSAGCCRAVVVAPMTDLRYPGSDDALQYHTSATASRGSAGQPVHTPGGRAPDAV